jgi:hypothetical protein
VRGHTIGATGPPAAKAPSTPARPRAPWGAEDDIAANQAIGGLPNFLLGALKTEPGIQAETLLVAAGKAIVEVKGKDGQTYCACPRTSSRC